MAFPMDIHNCTSPWLCHYERQKITLHTVLFQMTPVRACGVVVALLLVCVPLHAKVYTSADDEELFDQFRGKLGMKPSPLAFVTLG